MLETIREYAAEMLATRRRGGRRSRGRHAAAMLDLAERAAPRAVGRGPAGLARPPRARPRQPPGGARLGDRRARPAARRAPLLRDVAVLAAARLPQRGAGPVRGSSRRRAGSSTPSTRRGSRRRSAASPTGSRTRPTATRWYDEALAALAGDRRQARDRQRAVQPGVCRHDRDHGRRRTDEAGRAKPDAAERGAGDLSRARRHAAARATSCGGSGASTTSAADAGDGRALVSTVARAAPSGRPSDDGGVVAPHALARRWSAAHEWDEAERDRPPCPPALRRGGRRLGRDPVARRPRARSESARVTWSGRVDCGARRAASSRRPGPPWPTTSTQIEAPLRRLRRRRTHCPPTQLAVLAAEGAAMPSTSWWRTLSRRRRMLRRRRTWSAWDERNRSGESSARTRPWSTAASCSTTPSTEPDPGALHPDLCELRGRRWTSASASSSAGAAISCPAPTTTDGRPLTGAGGRFG